MRKFKQFIELIITPVQCIYMLMANQDSLFQFGDMEQNCVVVEPRSIPSSIHHFQRFSTHTYCGLLFCFVQLRRNDCPYFYK